MRLINLCWSEILGGEVDFPNRYNALPLQGENLKIAPPPSSNIPEYALRAFYSGKLWVDLSSNSDNFPRDA